MLLRTRRIGLPAVDQLASVQREMEHYFGHLLNGRPENGGVVRGWQPTVAMWEDADKAYLEIELPGVKTEDVDITVHNGLLRISGQRKAPEQERKYSVNDRVYGQFERAIALPEDVDSDSIDAQLSDGVLHIVLTKKLEAQPKKIAVRS
jgi:HSP20 family protein